MEQLKKYGLLAHEPSTQVACYKLMDIIQTSTGMIKYSKSSLSKQNVRIMGFIGTIKAILDGYKDYITTVTFRGYDIGKSVYSGGIRSSVFHLPRNIETLAKLFFIMPQLIEFSKLMRKHAKNAKNAVIFRKWSQKIFSTLTFIQSSALMALLIAAYVIELPTHTQGQLQGIYIALNVIFDSFQTIVWNNVAKESTTNNKQLKKGIICTSNITEYEAKLANNRSSMKNKKKDIKHKRVRG